MHILCTQQKTCKEFSQLQSGHFLSHALLQADLAGKDFTAEKQQVIVISAGNNKALTAKDQERNALERRAAERRHQHRYGNNVVFCAAIVHRRKHLQDEHQSRFKFGAWFSSRTNHATRAALPALLYRSHVCRQPSHDKPEWPCESTIVSQPTAITKLLRGRMHQKPTIIIDTVCFQVFPVALACSVHL